MPPADDWSGDERRQERRRILERRKEARKDELDKMIEVARLEDRSTPQKIFDEFENALLSLKSLSASFDLSAVLRQGAILTARHPVMAAKAFTLLMILV